jgi:hypothetical protein
MREHAVFHIEVAAVDLDRGGLVRVPFDIARPEVGLDPEHKARLVIDRDDIRFGESVVVKIPQAMLLEQ